MATREYCKFHGGRKSYYLRSSVFPPTNYWDNEATLEGVQIMVPIAPVYSSETSIL
jgi:hypothetical protein